MNAGRPPAPIEIVGGGLAGLALGGALGRAGVAVTLSEAGRYPRHRVCGEFIAGLGETTITRLGLAPFLADALRHRTVAWFVRDEPLRVQRLPSPALGLSRHALDARLADAFVAAGGTLRTGTRVADLAPRPGRIFALGRRRGSSEWIGLKIHARGLRTAHDLELHLGSGTYVGLSRVEDGWVNLCGLFRRRPVAAKGPPLLALYLRAAGLHGLAARLEAAETDAASFSAVAALSFERRPPPADCVSLGDACALIPPFTGNGMAMAFQGAELALDPLLAYARGSSGWDEVCRTVQARLRRRFRVRLASAGALHPFLLGASGQHWLAKAVRSRLLPLRPLYSLLH